MESKFLKKKVTCLKRLAAAVAFIAIIIFIWASITYLFRDTGYHRQNIVNFSREEDPVDVVFIGPSTTRRYWQPLKAWNDCGLSSYCYATDSLTPEAIKYYIKDILNTQDPELYVIDLRPFLDWSEEADEIILRRSTDSLPLFSLNRWQLLGDYLSSHEMTDDIDVTSLYLDIIKYHSNFDAVLGDAEHWYYMFNKTENAYKGYGLHDGYLYMEEYEGTAEEDEEREPAEGSVSVLYDLLDFCKKQEIEVLFVISPTFLTDAQQEEYAGYISILDEEGFSYLDTTDYYDEMNLNFQTDFYDRYHVNVYGAEKYTAFLEEYLKNNYDLPDHRGEDAYADWDDSYISFAEGVAASKVAVDDLIEERFDALESAELLAQTENAADWAIYSQSEYFIKIIVNQGTAADLDSLGIKSVLESMGVENALDDFQIIEGRYTITYAEQEEGNIIQAVVSETGASLSDSEISITLTDEGTSVLIDNVEYCRNEDGLNVILYDQNRKTVVDSVTLVNDTDGNVVLER